MPKREILCRARRTGLIVSVLSLVLLASTARSENWPRFRGPNGQGISNAKTVPSRWSEQDFNWKVELPGQGHSSPVVWGDRVFVTCAREKEARGFAVCVNAADGSELWRREHDLGKYRKNGLNSYAAATPAADAERLYVLWPGADETSLLALTHKGEPLWSIKLPGSHARHGLGGSPIVSGELVVVAHEQDENRDNVASVWLAVEGKSGEIRWRYEHPENTQASYSTPCVARSGYGKAAVANLIGAAGPRGELSGSRRWDGDRDVRTRRKGGAAGRGEAQCRGSGVCGPRSVRARQSNRSICPDLGRLRWAALHLP